MESKSSSICIVCGNKENIVFLKCTDFFISKENFTIKSCKSCGFRFTADAPAQENIGKYYKSEEYISHSNTQKGMINKLYHIVRNIMLARKWKLVKSHTPGMEILDIGCGTGYFLNFMKQKGYASTGIEVDDAARNFATQNFGLTVFSPEIISKEAPIQKYDIITLWHVLEHLHDAGKYLNWIFNSLKPDGKLIIAIPNCTSPDAAYYKQFWAAYDVPRHLWHFSPSSFEKYLNKFDFSLMKIKRMPFDAYYNSMMSSRYAGKKFSLINGLFIGILSNFLSLFNKKKASSVLYILEKRK